jgi:hypothetical protein
MYGIHSRQTNEEDIPKYPWKPNILAALATDADASSFWSLLCEASLRIVMRPRILLQMKARAVASPLTLFQRRALAPVSKQ